MKIYIAGPMRGIPYFNFPAFDACRDELVAKGHIVFSPADLDRQHGLDETKFPTGQWSDCPGVEGFDLKDLYLRDHFALSQCDAIVMLPGWTKSVGARMEYFGALFLELLIYRYNMRQIIPVSWAPASEFLEEYREVNLS